jgi:hypothetical protein
MSEVLKPQISVKRIDPMVIRVRPRETDLPATVFSSDREAVFPNSTGIVVFDVDATTLATEKYVGFDFNPGMSLVDLARQKNLTIEAAKRYIACGVRSLWREADLEWKESILTNDSAFVHDFPSEAILSEGKKYYLSDCLTRLDPYLREADGISEPPEEERISKIISLVDGLRLERHKTVNIESVDEPVEEKTVGFNIGAQGVGAVTVIRMVGLEEFALSSQIPFITIAISRIRGGRQFYQTYSLLNNYGTLEIDRHVIDPTAQRDAAILLSPLVMTNVSQEQLDEDARREDEAEEAKQFSKAFALEKKMGLSYVGREEAQDVINLLQTLRDFQQD